MAGRDGSGSGFCPTFCPTKEQFSKPFCDFVSAVFKKQPELAMFKVKPPMGWAPRKAPPDLDSISIQTPIKQMVIGTKGSFRCLLIEQKEMTAAQFKATAEDDDHRPSCLPHRGEVGARCASPISRVLCLASEAGAAGGA
jgi:hypothetical protein